MPVAVPVVATVASRPKGSSKKLKAKTRGAPNPEKMPGSFQQPDEQVLEETKQDLFMVNPRVRKAFNALLPAKET